MCDTIVIRKSSRACSRCASTYEYTYPVISSSSQQRVEKQTPTYAKCTCGSRLYTDPLQHHLLKPTLSTASTKRGAEVARGPEMVKQALTYGMEMIAVRMRREGGRKAWMWATHVYMYPTPRTEIGPPVGAGPGGALPAAIPPVRGIRERGDHGGGRGGAAKGAPLAGLLVCILCLVL